MGATKIRHPYFYPAEMVVNYEKINSVEDLGFTHPDGRVISPIFVTERDETVYFLGSSGSRLYLSDDEGETWERILDAGLGEGRIELAVMTNHPNIDESIVFVGGNSKVYKSTDLNDSSHNSWQLIIDEPSSGYFSSRYGWSLNGRIMMLSSYGSLDAENPPRFIYLSRDWGETFEEIEMKTISEMENPETFHIHDVEYDPYSSRIWVAVGDQENSNVYYSDDWGVNFERIYAHDSRTTQPTSIHALPDRVIFGSDDQPNGIKVWYRNNFELKNKVKPEDIKLIFTPDTFESENPLRNVAQLPSTEFKKMISSYPYNILLPFSAAGNSEKTSRILATPNGQDYFEIFRTDHIHPDLSRATINRLIPSINGTKVYVSLFDSQEGAFIVKLDMPDWIKVG